MTVKSPRVIISAVIVVAILGVILIARQEKQEAPQAALLSDVPVTVVPVQKQRLSSSISLVGTINANNDVNVVAETQGVAQAVFVKVGDQVQKGTVLVKADDEIQRSNLAAAEINFEKAKRDYDRSEALYQENSISIAQLEAARLGLKAAENQRDIVRRTLQNTEIKSPVNGTVNARFVNEGTMIGQGTAVANVVDISTLKVRVNVTEREAFQIKVGDEAEIATDVYPGVVFKGRIDNVASKADEAHTYAVEIRVPNSTRQPLKAGMFARVSFLSITPTAALVIPRVALIGSIKNAEVFTVRGGRASLRQVILGRQTSAALEVLQGLEPGDSVVTSGQNNLVDQAKVMVVSALGEKVQP